MYTYSETPHFQEAPNTKQSVCISTQNNACQSFCFQVKGTSWTFCFSGATDVKLIKCCFLRLFNKPLLVNTQFQFVMGKTNLMYISTILSLSRTLVEVYVRDSCWLNESSYLCRLAWPRRRSEGCSAPWRWTWSWGPRAPPPPRSVSPQLASLSAGHRPCWTVCRHNILLTPTLSTIIRFYVVVTLKQRTRVQF